MKISMFTPEEKERQIADFESILLDSMGELCQNMSGVQIQQRAEAAFAAFDRTDIGVTEAMDNALNILFAFPPDKYTIN